MELFNEDFIYCVWDNSLKGMKGFCADNIGDLITLVNSPNAENYLDIIKRNTLIDYPFNFGNNKNNNWRFAYYDPYFIYRKAYLEGKRVQVDIGKTWEDVTEENYSFVFGIANNKFRIKDKTDYVVIFTMGEFYVIEEDELKVEHNIYYKGSFEDCANYWGRRTKEECIVAECWEKGCSMQYHRKGDLNDDWHDSLAGIIDLDNYEYRPKPDSKKCIKDRVLTNYELSKWLAKGYGQVKYKRGLIATCFTYMDGTDNESTYLSDTKIRFWGDNEWHEPTICYINR